MKKVLLLFYLTFIVVRLTSGQGTWTWISGDTTTAAAAVFGTQGMPSANNHPPGVYEPAEWKDKQGNFWIYGGWDPPYTDLWKFDPLSKEWTWVKGTGSIQLAFYGTQGVGSPSNTPGKRTFASATWVDTSGTMWLFGGEAWRNDLWKYDMSANQWIWMKGDTTYSTSAVHGTQGIPSAANKPGARDETASAWVDSSNNLWLFGGNGYDEIGSLGFLNDVWKYDISSNEWTWMKGSAFVDVSPSYGVKGISDIGNDPGSRDTYTKWKDKQGNFWLMGGYNYTYGCLNDVWKFNPAINEWTWMSGPSSTNDPGSYQTSCTFDNVNMPYSRYEQRSAVTDYCGLFWLFGGWGFPSSNFNDLWVFNSETLQWSWLSGTNVPNQQGNFGILGVASAANMPPSRRGSVAWWGNDNKFYLFGGTGGFTLDNRNDVWVFDPDTGCVPVCPAIVAPPVAALQSSDTMFCANDCINYTDLSINATGWQWSFPGGLPSSSSAQNPQSICYPAQGNYDVTLIAYNSGGYDTLTFTDFIGVFAAPPTPVITKSNDTLFCSTDPGYISYQWYQDNSLIPGATDTILVVTQSGNYNVSVSNENGCSIAVGINIIIGVPAYLTDNRIMIYPNPVNNELVISVDLPIGKAGITIYDVLGQRVYFSDETIDAAFEMIIDVKKFSRGVYLIQLDAEDNVIYRAKLLKE